MARPTEEQLGRLFESLWSRPVDGSFTVGFVFVTAIVIVAGLIGSVLSYVLRRGTRESAIRNICFFMDGIDKEPSVPQRSFLD
jgi:hypothetical protein